VPALRPPPARPDPARALCALLLLALVLSGCRQVVELAGVEDVELPVPAESSVITAADGSVLTTLHGGEDREMVPLERVPKVLRDAVVAVEDARFLAHSGVDARAVARALAENLDQGRVAQGGSTITQQLVKNAFTGGERTLRRKAVEATVALSLEQRYTKDAILERYLNTVYFGHGAYGVATAARRYFAVEVEALSLPQAALLAALVRSPAADDPHAAPQRARERRDLVLTRMAEQGLAGAEEIAAARSAPLGLVPLTPAPRLAPLFVDHVRGLLVSDPAFAVLGGDAAARERRLSRGGLTIETTLDPRWQNAAEDAVTATVPLPSDPQAVLVAVSPSDGAVRAMAARREPGDEGGLNLATRALRQPGSTFKALVLATALTEGHTLDETYPAGSSVTVAGGEGEAPWTVANHEGHDPGVVTLGAATAHSVNTVYARLITAVGPGDVVVTAQAAGVDRALRPLPSLALGAQEVTPLEMAVVAGTLAAGGEHRAPWLVERILGPDGAVLYQSGGPGATQALEPAVAWLTTAALRRTVVEGTGRRADLRRPLAGKTGTSSDSADAWFLGYTPDLAAAVWIGFPEGRVPMEPPRTRIRVEGGNWPAELFARFGARALADVPAHEFVPPVPQDGRATLGLVPDVTGLPAEPAAAMLERAGLLTSPLPAAASATVSGQTPPAGSPAAPGMPVRLHTETPPGAGPPAATPQAASARTGTPQGPGP